MRWSLALMGLLIVIGTNATLFSGCAPPPEVKVRPPEPRVEVYGSPPCNGKAAK